LSADGGLCHQQQQQQQQQQTLLQDRAVAANPTTSRAVEVWARDTDGPPTQRCTQHRLSLFSSWKWETDKLKTLIFVNGRSKSVRLLFLPNNCALAARRKFRSWKFTGYFEVVNTAVLCLWCLVQVSELEDPKKEHGGKNK
jgi:hypothetical protein